MGDGGTTRSLSLFTVSEEQDAGWQYRSTSDEETTKIVMRERVSMVDDWGRCGVFGTAHLVGLVLWLQHNSSSGLIGGGRQGPH